MKLERRGDVSEEAHIAKVEDRPAVNSKKREISVMIYTVVLFVVALALILLSYKIQQRANNTLSDITEQHGEVTAQALRNIEELQNKNLELTGQLDEAKNEARDLQRQLEDAQEKAQTQISELEQERDSLNAQLKELTLKIEDLEKRAQAAGTLTELVMATDETQRDELLHQMASLSQYLDGAGTDIYNSYIESMNTQEAEE